MGASVDLQSCLGHNWVQLSSSWSPFGVLKDWYMLEFQLGHLFCIVISVSPPFLSFLHVIYLFASLYLIGMLLASVWIRFFYIRVGDRLVKISKQSGMDPQHDRVDRPTVTMTLFRMH